MTYGVGDPGPDLGQACLSFLCVFCSCISYTVKSVDKICLKLFIKIFYCINPHQHCIIQIVQERVTIINTTKQRQIIKILVIIDEYMYARH